ncbi:MAG: ABC transporter permease [Candidatus Gracilibacteria bacterium]|nr:ABC transporter permease [Candidatus Gracilibacteria bacterium]MDD2908797.1 ABC transporter permease [Candidatus Gracilibacteria bacterium]
MLNIALNTFRELKRNKILYMILFFGILLIVFSIALASLSLGQTEKIILDFGLAMIEVFGLVSVIFIGSQLIFNEINGKTIYLILSKPISRFEFILGKFLGFALILAFIVFFQTVIFLAIVFYTKTSFDLLIIFSIIFIYLKLLILFAIILFFSTFVSSILAIVLTIIVYIISHGITSIIDMAARSNNYLMLQLGKILYVTFPNFEALNIKNLILSPVKIEPTYLIFNSAYGLVYLAIILGLTIVIFNRKTFEN